MRGEEEDDFLPLGLVGETLLQRLADVVGKGLDESGVRSPAVDETPFHRRRVAAERKIGGKWRAFVKGVTRCGLNFVCTGDKG